MKKMAFFILLGFMLMLDSQAQTITESDNTPLLHYSIHLNGVSSYADAKDLNAYDYLEGVFGSRPVFNPSTSYFEVDSREVVTLSSLTTALSEYGLVPTEVVSKPADQTK